MNFDPARSRRHHLPPIFNAPALHEADSNGAHTREFEDFLEALVDRLCQLVSKELVVEDTHYAARRDLAYRCRVPVVAHVRVHALDEDAALGEALCVDLSSDVKQPDPSPDVSPRLFDDSVAVDVRQKPQTESVR